MSYYHNLITEASWKQLQELKRQYNFTLIGGWAVYLYTKALKSRDIDFICDFKELEKLKNAFPVVKNDRLKKYEIHQGEFDIDIYVPFYSDFVLPAEDLLKMTKSIEGFSVLSPEALLILKQKAFSDRKGSLKGEKDKIDIASLLFKGAVDMKHYEALLKDYGLTAYKTALRELFSSLRSVPEISLSEHAFAQLKKKIFDTL